MEGSSIVDELRYCWTLVHENQRREPGDVFRESWFVTKAEFLSTRANLDRRTGKIPLAYSKGIWSFGRVDADSSVDLRARQGLHHHGPWYNIFLFSV